MPPEGGRRHRRECGVLLLLREIRSHEPQVGGGPRRWWWTDVTQPGAERVVTTGRVASRSGAERLDLAPSAARQFFA